MIGTLYRVEINNVSGEDEGAGFIDPNRVEHYDEVGSFEDHVNKERGNYRYKLMLQSLQSVGNIYVVNEEDDPVAIGGSATTAPTRLSLVLHVERGEASLIADVDGELMTGADLIKHLVAKSMLITRTVRADVLDPTYRGPVVDDYTVGALTNDLTTAYAAITVNQL